jgi:1,2-diacylglycerol 3-alpha-glucosyltransferase
LIEASLCGLPIVARRDRAYAGLVRDGYNGYQVERDGEIAGRIAELLADEARRQALASNALAQSAQFSAERHVAQLEALYRRLLDNRSVGGG